MTKPEFAQAVKKAAYREGDFVLRSGRRSKYYLDKYRFETDPVLLREVGRRLSEHLTGATTRIAGAELGGIALAAVVSLESGVPFVIVRNKKKEYGTGNVFEGVIERGDTVLLVEDIATTGGQVLEAAKDLTAFGAQVEKIVAVLDRQEGARENIEGAGYRFESLLTAADLGIAKAPPA